MTHPGALLCPGDICWVSALGLAAGSSEEKLEFTRNLALQKSHLDLQGAAILVGAMELTAQQISTLERLHTRGFEIVAFPMYANYVGIRRGNCAALLAPMASGSFRLYGQTSYLVAGNLSVRVTRDGKEWFVWKKDKLEATAARLAELTAFSVELGRALLSTI